MLFGFVKLTKFDWPKVNFIGGIGLLEGFKRKTIWLVFKKAFLKRVGLHNFFKVNWAHREIGWIPF